MFWKRFSDFNGYSIFLFSEPMAIIPYLLRSLRIQKMFKAREIYCQTGTIPKQMIRNWNETRIMKIMLSIVFVVGLTYSTFGMLYTPDIIDTITQFLPNYNQLGIPMYNDGSFCDVRMPNELSYGILFTTSTYVV